MNDETPEQQDQGDEGSKTGDAVTIIGCLAIGLVVLAIVGVFLMTAFSFVYGYFGTE